MTTNQKTLLRQWHMLHMVPRAPRKISVQAIRAGLADAEFVVTERTIQRDLQELSHVFPLLVDERDKPFGWSWRHDSPNFDLPGLSVPEALTLALVEQHLANALPPATLDSLRPYFMSASQALGAIDKDAQSNAWLSKVRTIPPMQRLIAPVIDSACQRSIYDGLMRDCQLKIAYRKRDATSVTVYESVHPLAVIQRGQIIYLICMFADYTDIRMLPLHRVTAAEVLYLPSRKNAQFKVDEYIESGHMGFCADRVIRLKAVFSRAAGEHLFETALSRDQVLRVLQDGRIELTSSVPETRELTWWLLGFGDGVEVIEPLALREEMAATVQRMARAYEPAKKGKAGRK
jgi:predicted DNA-binding transcriptional regulator YafY